MLGGLLVAVPASAERVSEAQLKAAFLFHITVFVEWPPTAFADASAPFRLCLVGGDPFGAAIRTLETKRYRERAIRVLELADADAAAGCQLIYFHGPVTPAFAAIAHGQAGRPQLTVSSEQDFAIAGGGIGFRSVDGRVRMEVNLAATRIAGLKVSAKLLEVALRVLDDNRSGAT